MRKRRRLAGWAGAVLGAMLAVVWLRLGPIPPIERTTSLTIVDRNGERLYEPLAASGNRTHWISADAIPLRIADATIVAEDRRFHRHPGVDPIAVARATLHNVRARRVVEGGSTITQQVAKLVLQSRDRSLRSKWRETVVALRLEHRYTKREILAMYLNLAPYGNRITGVARASRAYFGCAPEQLTPAQAAFLASLPQRPSAFNPLRNAEKARPRQLMILARMNLTAQERANARAERLQFAKTAHPTLAMHFIERVLAATQQPSNPATIQTTLDATLQRAVTGIIHAHKDNLLEHGAHSVAVAVLDNATGEWLAWEGSGDYFDDAFGGAIDGVVTPRQPGSTLKPFTYALAFEDGESPATVIADVPSHFPTAEHGIVYTPRNYDGRYRGPLRIRAALAGSENIPAVAMLAKLGPEALLRMLRNAGFTGLERTADYYGLGLTLGDAEVTLEQLVTAYAAFARGGKQVRTTMLLPPPRDRVTAQLVSPRTAFFITDILTDPEARAWAFGTGGSLDFPFPVAVKTGTSSSYRDNWTIGYTKDVTVGVWAGNFDRRELRGSSGLTGAAPIFHGVMLAAMTRARGKLPIGDSTPILEPPHNAESIEICTLSGLRPSTYCESTRKEWLPTEAAPRFCSWHHDGAIDWPAEYRAWARQTQPRAVQASKTTHRRTLEIANPPDGATYLIDPTLRLEFQTIRLRATSSTRVTWQIDGRPVATEWPLARGRHTITATDADGRHAAVQILVK